MGNSNEQLYYEEPIFWERSHYGGKQQARAQQILSWIPQDTKSVLDVGCGNGFIIDQIPSGINTFGVDRSRAALKWVQSPCGLSDVSRLPFQDNAFDVVLSNEVIEHIPFNNYHQCLDEIVRVARKYIIITVPYQENLNKSKVCCPKCGCCFHANYHMRNYKRYDIKNLFLTWNSISFVRSKGIIPIERRYLNELKSAIIQKKTHHQDLFFRKKTLCPQCGFSSIAKDSSNFITDSDDTISSAKRTTFQTIKSFVSDMFVGYVPNWWLAMYKKV
jgi:SAM-dependent methyltransferase